MPEDRDKQYIEGFLKPIRKCKNYKPKFGNSQNEKGFSLEDFLVLYNNDPFYSWVGLNSELMYAAHKAAGGMTSVYRQIGVSCEYLFRQVVNDMCGYDNPQHATWSYTSNTKSGASKTLSLDARLELSEIKNAATLRKVETWLIEYCKELNEVQLPKNGIVFEVRQGYKSKDSKRQNADIDNATVAWANGYMPFFAIFSGQIDTDIVLRYKNNRCGILIGIASTNDKESIYAFSKNILGYDLAVFFQRNSKVIQQEVHAILTTLLTAK